MGPRVAGFLVGSLGAAAGCFLLLQYDVMRKYEATDKQLNALSTNVAKLCELRNATAPPAR